VRRVTTRILRLISELSDIYATAFDEINRLGGEQEYASRALQNQPTAEPTSKAQPRLRSMEAISDDILATYESELTDVYKAALEEAQRLRGEKGASRIDLDQLREKYAQDREELHRMRAELEKETEIDEELFQEKERRPISGRREDLEFRRPARERKTLYEQLDAGIRGVCRSCGNEVSIKDLFCDNCGAYLVRVFFR
jgi:hypothetical protein